MEWLAAAATDPRACKRQWHGTTGTAVLACGRFWDVLSVPQQLGLMALDALLCIPQAPGPALADFVACRVGFFLPPDPIGRWVGSEIRYLGTGAWLTVPPPDRAAGHLRWLVPPDGAGTGSSSGCWPRLWCMRATTQHPRICCHWCTPTRLRRRHSAWRTPPAPLPRWRCMRPTAG
ncbi:hypothetical protein HEP84_55695 [Streptomyces sp. RLB1-33]|nr:hypothetical protein [Streptomyces sp. RLB1-33]